MERNVAEREQEASLRSRIATKLGIGAGVVDAAMSSLATFLTGLIAATILGDADLGVYAIFFTAFNFGQVVANNLIFVPAEVIAVAWPAGDRTRVITQSIMYGTLPSLVGALSIGSATLVAAQIATADVVLPLTITAAITTLLWPSQDHTRRMLHIADRSWAAASVSAVHLAITAIAVWALIIANVPAAWVPFGALAIANLLSLILALILARPWTAGPAPERLNPMNLVRSGVWLMVGVGVQPVAAFGAASIITFTAGPVALGYAEAARIAAVPIIVLGTGLGYVMGPRVMRAAIARDIAVSRHNHRRFNTFLFSAAAIYAVVVGFDWIGNPMARLVPKAYIVDWLVVVTVFANVFLAGIVLVLQELTAAGRTKAIAMVSIVSAPLQMLVAATAGVTQAFARPMSLAVGNGARLYGTRRAIAGIYRSPSVSDRDKGAAVV
jgi:O-antigen/teichoic acid export membrane protein